MSLVRQVHVGWRRALSLLGSAFALTVGFGSLVVLPVAPALVVLALAAGLAAGLLRRARWTGRQWEGHVAFKKQAARELLRADEGQRTRPPMW